jgi:predicted acylesterase/phospholipase RssA
MATKRESHNGKPQDEKPQEEKIKRAITLGGGGPAAGLHIGVLEALAGQDDIHFDVWALSCIGAWVGIVYNQFEREGSKNKAELTKKERTDLTYQFFKNGVFRDDESYERFPINSVFGPDWGKVRKAVSKFIREPNTYNDLFDPYQVLDSFQASMSMLLERMPDKENKTTKKWDKGDVNRWILNDVMAPNPFVRYLTSMMYLSNLTGLSRINYPDSEFMNSINFERLRDDDKPIIFHNAWNLDDQRLALFCNRHMDDPDYVGDINASTLCACSALPFIEETVEIGKQTYCEGALVDTVNFESLLEEHHDLDEIWISRIVDSKQIRKPKNLHDSLANLCQLFAATVGEDDVKLFKYHVKCDQPRRWKGTVVEIHVPSHIDFKWNHSNLDRGRDLGRAAAERAIAAYRAAGGAKFAKDNETARFINEDPPLHRKGRSHEIHLFNLDQIDKDRLMQAIRKVKPGIDRMLLSRKMKWWVDSEGNQVKRTHRGEFPACSEPYPVFALRNTEVKKAYEERNPGPGADKL